MAGNQLLGKAKDAKKDEFYTQLSDIENELKYYKEQLKGKIIFCNCDDPYESHFFKYFAMNFNLLGLKKLIATCYGSSSIAYSQLNLFGEEEIATKIESDRKTYKIEITEVDDLNGDGAVDLSDVELLLKSKRNTLSLLEGDGDFRSPECVELLKEADIVITNPPFSLFRDYVAQLVQYDKKFLIIGDMNALKYKEIFPLIQNKKMWAGYGFNITMIFQSPYENTLKSNQDYVKAKGYDPGKYLKKPRICWYTNLFVKKHTEKMILYKKYSPAEYFKYDNYDAIEISDINSIPYDYDGLMGVPISFLGKHNPEQFEIVGESDLPETLEGITALGQEWIDNYRKGGGTGHYTAGMKSLGYSADGRYRIIFSRLIIRKIGD